MFARRCTRSRAVKIALATVVLLVAALGVCVAETGHGTHGHGTHGMFVDLCTGLALVTPVIMLFARPLLVGLVSVQPATAVVSISIRLHDPPPKLAFAL